MNPPSWEPNMEFIRFVVGLTACLPLTMGFV
jgi:hypothetical protein